MEELERGAVRLDAVAGALETLVGRLDAVRSGLGGYAATIQPYPAAAMEQLGRCSVRARDALGEIRGLSGAIRTARGNYAHAEAQAAMALRMRETVFGLADGFRLRLALALYAAGLRSRSISDFGEDPVAHWFLDQVAGGLGAHPGSSGLRDNADQLMGGLPEVLEGLTGGLLPIAPAALLAAADRADPAGTRRSEAAVAERLAALVGWDHPGAVSVHRVDRDGAAAAPATLAPTLEAMYSSVAASYSAAPSAVTVQRVDRTDGTTAWVVDVPGTEDWSTLDTGSVFDMESNLQGLAAQKTANVRSLVDQSMASAGVRPGDPVILNSHSGGGINAAAMVSDQDFMARYNVQMLNVAGSPIGYFPIPPTVSVLALENVNDATAGLDGMANPDTANLVTVTTGPRPGAAELGATDRIVNAHAIGEYTRDARVLDSSPDPSVLAHKEKLARLLGSPGGGPVTVTVSVYQGTDAPARPAGPGPH
ncbi:MAG TPA: hypothetical protein VIG41_10625 [Micrococcaceae bacterium]